MNKTEFRTRGIVAACMLALGFASSTATAQTSSDQNVVAKPPVVASAASADKRDAIAQINRAVRVVDEMKREPQVHQLLQDARGVFIMTSYARAGLGVGVRAGEGVLMVKQNSNWSNPAFYDFGGVSGGLQAGAEAGSLVMVLNSEKAVQSFMQKNNWSLNADAGVTIVKWSERAKGEVGTGDITVWSNASGLMADVAVSVTDIFFDEEETGAFYGRQIALRDLLSTDMEPLPHIANLKQALPGGTAQSTGRGTGDTASDASSTIVPEEQGATSQGGSGTLQNGRSRGGDSQGGNIGTSGGNATQPLEKHDNKTAGTTSSGTVEPAQSSR